MTIDTEGNIYLTGSGGGVRVFDKNAKSLGTIPVPQVPANICFGGKDKQTLFICARTGFYSIPMKFKGANQSK